MQKPTGASKLNIIASGLMLLLAGCGKEEPVPPEIILPEVLTSSLEYITPKSAFCSGTIISIGNSYISEKGLCWDDEPLPDTTDTRKAAYEIIPYLNGFTFLLTDLVPETSYYVRAYAISNKGTVYGNELSFITPADLSGEAGTVADVEGNVYQTISIGTQVWITENLKTTKLNDGTDIPEITDNKKWSFTCTPARCWYDNKEHYRDTYGALYNWYVAGSGKICPEGWHVPSDDEWIIIESFLGGGDVAGIKMKEAGFEHWIDIKYAHEATNESGFTGLPGGERADNGYFEDIGEQNFFWSSTCNGTGAWYRVQSAYGDYNFRGCLSILMGGSIRCIKD